MRTALEGLYRLSGALSACFLVAILLIVLVQVGFNMVDWVLQHFSGRPLGLLIPSYADFAGYFLAAATFFALGYSFHHGAHIRVNLVLTRLPERLRRLCETMSAGMAALLSAYFAWYAGGLAHDSWRFGDVSPGLVAIPLWLPQAAMTAGLVVLCIATADAFVMLLTGRAPAYAKAETGLEEGA